MATATPEAAEVVLWISGAQACEILRTYPARFKQIAAESRVRTLRAPGCFTRFALADVLAIAAEARQTREACPC